MPPMYAKLHRINWKDRLIEFSKNIKDDFIDSEFHAYKCVQKFMCSLKKAGIPLFPEYTNEERNMILNPQLLLKTQV